MPTFGVALLTYLTIYVAKANKITQFIKIKYFLGSAAASSISIMTRFHYSNSLYNLHFIIKVWCYIFSCPARSPALSCTKRNTICYTTKDVVNEEIRKGYCTGK